MSIAIKTSNGIETVANVGGGSGGESYSTTEQAIGTWIDGRTLYQRTYTYESHRLESGANALFSVQGLEIINYDFIMSNSAHNVWSDWNVEGTNHINVQFNPTNCYVYASTTWGTPNIIITIKYVKTTA